MSTRDLYKDRRYVSPSQKAKMQAEAAQPKKRDILDELGDALKERIDEISESVSEAISEKYEEVSKDVSTYVDRQMAEAHKKIDETFPTTAPAEGEAPADKPFLDSLIESVTGLVADPPPQPKREWKPRADGSLY